MGVEFAMFLRKVYTLLFIWFCMEIFQLPVEATIYDNWVDYWFDNTTECSRERFFEIMLLPAEEKIFDKWINYAAEDFLGGTGTEKDPYQIDTPERLARLALVVNKRLSDKDGKHFREKFYLLVNNIDLGAHHWVPIGETTFEKSSPFKGMFDGNGYKISNLTMKRDEIGLFGVIINQKDRINLLNIDLISVDLVGQNGGALAARNYGKVENCSASGMISDIRPNEALYFGGLIGLNTGKVTNCTANVSLHAMTRDCHEAYLGGLVGINEGLLYRCTANSNISISGITSWGGLLMGKNAGIVKKSSATGRVRGTRGAGGSGLIGENLIKRHSLCW